MYNICIILYVYSAMIAEARKSYPEATFAHGNFLNLDKDVFKASFDVIVFNECLHYFTDIYAVLYHAKQLLTTSTTDSYTYDNSNNTIQHSTISNTYTHPKRVIISHPKGYNNILLQRAKNKSLVPSLLPNTDEIRSLASRLGFKITLEPNTKANTYMAILEYDTV